MKKLFISALLAAVICTAALAESEAVDLAKKCTVRASGNGKYVSRMFSDGFNTYWPCKPGDSLTVQTPADSPAQGVMVSFLGDAARLTVEAEGHFTLDYSEDFVCDYIPFPEPVGSFTVTVREGPEEIRINRLCVLSEGVLPGWVQRWERMEAPADIMLVSTHPDDELLWFGGLLPTYAGEYQKKVQLVYMVGSSARRRCELLAGLWACGVRYYPEIGSFPDRGASSVKSCLGLWGEDATRQYIAGAIRKFRPAVVVTQDINGEYGHVHHQVTVQATIDAVTALAADAEWDPASAERYGLWQPHKLYLHLWKDGQIVFDWRVPLSAFDGETGLSVARNAFKLHASQQTGKYRVQDSGKLDSRLLGLYWSDVGPDEAKNDLLEHIE